MKVTGIILTLLLIFPLPAAGGGRLDLSWGRGEEGSNRYRGALALDWQRVWSLSDGMDLSGYWEAGIERWKEDRDSLYAASFMPVFRIKGRINGRKGIYLFVDGAIGLYLLSESTLGDKRFSTAFQFGDHLGMGLIVGSLEMGYRFEHLSNGGINSPNPGINFHLFRIGYRF